MCIRDRRTPRGADGRFQQARSAIFLPYRRPVQHLEAGHRRGTAAGIRREQHIALKAAGCYPAGCVNGRSEKIFAKMKIGS